MYVTMTVMLIVFVTMLAEMWLSRANERGLRGRGAIEPDDDVYPWMAVAYPASFAAMGIEGLIRGAPSAAVIWFGLLVFVAAKGIKYWAIASLGPKWTFRVLVLPGTPLVTTGPYAWLRHPNYLGVVGELVGGALMVGAPVTGAAACLGFGYLLQRRISVEDRALGRDHAAGKGV